MSDNVNPVEEQQEIEPSPPPVEESGGTEPGTVPEEKTIPPSPKPGLAEEKRLKNEFQLGLTLGLILNGIAAIIYISLMLSRSNWPLKWGDGVWEFGIVWLVANILILALLAFWKRKAFEGLIAGLTLAFLIVFSIGALVTVTCYGGF